MHALARLRTVPRYVRWVIRWNVFPTVTTFTTHTFSRYLRWYACRFDILPFWSTTLFVLRTPHLFTHCTTRTRTDPTHTGTRAFVVTRHPVVAYVTTYSRRYSSPGYAHGCALLHSFAIPLLDFVGRYVRSFPLCPTIPSTTVDYLARWNVW